jgi:hypothetical protein
MVNRRVVPTSAIDVAAAKRGANKSAVVPIGGGSEVYLRTAGTIVVRGTKVTPAHRLGTKAKAMKACAGKKGCEFMSCLEAGGVTPPRSIRKSCAR